MLKITLENSLKKKKSCDNDDISFSVYLKLLNYVFKNRMKMKKPTKEYCFWQRTKYYTGYNELQYINLLKSIKRINAWLIKPKNDSFYPPK